MKVKKKKLELKPIMRQRVKTENYKTKRFLGPYFKIFLGFSFNPKTQFFGGDLTRVYYFIFINHPYY